MTRTVRKSAAGRATVFAILTVFWLCAPASAQETRQSPAVNSPTIVIDIALIDIRADQAIDLERTVKDPPGLSRLISEGKAKAIATLQMRARSGEQATARMGQRVPIQVAYPAQGAAVSASQVAYENTGLNVDANPAIAGEQIQIRLKVDLSSVVRNPGMPNSPIFIQRTVGDIVRVHPGETTVLLSAVQHESLWPDLPPVGAPAAPASSQVGQLSGNFAVLVTARILN